MYTNVIVPRQWSRLACLCRSAASLEGGKVPAGSAGGEGLAPPARVRRGPTDLLRALAATLGPDPTAAHYKYHDDPYLIPLSNYRKRAYALSAEAGRKAAAWVRDEHAPLFTQREWDPPLKMKTPHHNAEPRIEAFTPRPIYNDESKVTQEDLKYTIANALVEDAVKVYELLGGSGGVSGELQLSLLQLLCFYNERQPDSPDWLEERWFSTATKERHAATWRLGGLADKLFTAMEPKSPEAYCAIIQGMAKYYQAERAHALAAEARERGVPLSTGVYNALVGCVGFLREGVALRVEALKGLLQEMGQAGLSPDNETLSMSLRSLAAWGGGRALQQVALDVVAECRQHGVAPSLGAYYHLLCLFCKERGPRTDVLSSILQELEQRPGLEPLEPTDTNFFVTAMSVCSDHLQDVGMARRVHALLLRHDNYRVVGDAYRESIYYRHYLTVHCRHAPLEQTLELLDTLVPHVYVPEPSVMEQIIVTLEAGGCGGCGARLAQAWSQLVIFGHARRVRLVERLLQAMLCVYQYQEEEVKAQIRSAAADILRFGQVQAEQQDQRDMRTPAPLTLSADALSAIVQLCSDGPAGVREAGAGVGAGEAGGWEAVRGALERLKEGQAAGVPREPGALVEVAKRAAEQGKHGIAAMAVSYLAECGFEEALEAARDSLSVALNRSSEETDQLLSRHPAQLQGTLQPAALEIVQAYHLAKSGGAPSPRGAPRSPRGAPRSPRGAFSSSSSDSEGSSSDDER